MVSLKTKLSLPNTMPKSVRRTLRAGAAVTSVLTEAFHDLNGTDSRIAALLTVFGYSILR